MKLLIPLAAAIALSTTACAVDSGPDVRADTDESSEHLGQTAQQVTVNICTGPGFSLLRYYSAAATDHFYTTNFNELGNGASGYRLEGTAGTLFSSVFQACGAVPLYRFNIPGVGHLYTTSFNEGANAGLSFEGVPGYCFPTPGSGLTPLYRYFSGAALDHFYTTNFNELGNGAGGYGLEGIQCYVAP